MFVTSTRIYKKYHISMYFLRKIIFHFSSKKKISCFPVKNTSCHAIQDRSYPSGIFLKRPSFENIWIKYHISMIFFFLFFWERSSFIFRLRGNIIFSGRRKIIFPDDARKIIFQRNFFGKSIFSGHAEKENMAFGAVSKFVTRKLSVSMIIQNRIMVKAMKLSIIKKF